MSTTVRRLMAGLIALAIGIGLVVLYRGHRTEGAREAERDAPVVAPSRVTGDSETVVVALRPDERSRVGVELAILRSASRGAEQRLAGDVVPETERAAVLRAPVAGRFTVPDGARWPTLGERVAPHVTLAQVSDARPLTLPIGGIVTRVGAHPGALVEAGQVLLEVADYSRPLVRVAWLDPTGTAPPARLLVGPASAAARVAARLVGPAPDADPVTRRPAYLYRAERAWPGATPGTPVLAYVEAPAPAGGNGAAKGALVPDAAVVQWQGLAWAYRARGPDRFERVRVVTDHPAAGGWVVDGPLAAGDSVVVRGAEELLSEEFRARVTVGDESGE
jgi:multidrug efflux pump subunit AcrA (membrane-fusion protein)